MAYCCDDTGRRGCTPQPGYPQTTYPIPTGYTPQTGYIPTMYSPTGFNAFSNEAVTNYDTSYTVDNTYTFQDMTSMQTTMYPPMNMSQADQEYFEGATYNHTAEQPDYNPVVYTCNHAVDMTQCQCATPKDSTENESQVTEQAKKKEARKGMKAMIIYGACLFGIGIFCGLFAYHATVERLYNNIVELQASLLEFQKNAEEFKQALEEFQALAGYPVAGYPAF